MQKTATASIKQQQRGNTHRGGLFHPLLVSVFLIAINLFSATGLAQVSPYAVEISGEASVEVADNFETGEATYRYFIIDRQSKTNDKTQGNRKSRGRTEIFFRDKPHEQFQTGKKLRVHGKRRANGRDIDLESLELLEPDPDPDPGTGTEEAAPPAGAPLATEETRKILTLLVDFNDAFVYDFETPANTPKGAQLQDVKDLMFHNSKNVSHFYDLASLGTLTIPSDPNGTGGDAVYGPYAIDYNYLGGDSAQCDVDAWQDAALTAWENVTGFSRSDYRHHSFILPNYRDYNNRNCSWAGYANLGCGTSCWAFSADPVSILHGVIVHELGHNFTFHHARTDPNNDGITDAEYGDPSDMMGGSRNWMKFNPPHFEHKGWYDPATYQLRTITPSSTLQFFDLIPVDEEDTEWPGLRALKTNRNGATSYYLSYRQQTGYYNDVNSISTTGASLHWRDNTGSASYLIRMIETGDVFVDGAADLVVWGVGPMTIDNSDSTDETQIFTLKVCNTTCEILLRPLNLVARGIYADSIELTWQDYTYDEDGFTVEYSPDGSSWSALGTAAANAVSYLHPGLDVGSTFYYRVRAYRGGSEASDWSGIASATTPSTNPDIAPDLTPATDTGVSDSDNITTDSTPDFYVACSGIGNNITLYTDNPATYPGVGTYICKTTGTETATVTTALAVGIHHIVYTEEIGSSESGNSPFESGNSPSLAITIDPPAPTDHFVTTWQTDNPGESNSTSITVPMVGGPYDVDWDGDGAFDELGLTGSVTHDYGTIDSYTYTIRIRGAYESIQFAGGGDKEKILSLDQWGTQSWTTMAYAFSGAANLQVPATDTPDFSAVTSMYGMFQNATSANPDTSGWNTSAVKNMGFMFSGTSLANPDTSSWNTSAVTKMYAMFYGAATANPNTSGWNTSAVTNMGFMFSGTGSANPNTSGWNTSAVTNMYAMFNDAATANPNTSGWNTSMVTNMGFMFSDTSSANPNTSSWDTGEVTNMEYMFQLATAFDQDVGSWDVTALADATGMFHGVTLSKTNYESLLIGWNAQTLNAEVTFSGGNSTYCSAEAVAARANMIASDSWVITDVGQACSQIIFNDSFETH